MKRSTLAIADDHEILRTALSGDFARNAGFDVVGSVGDAQAAVVVCAQKQPDLLLLDIEMPGRDALSAISDIKAHSPKTKVVILTAYCRDALIQLALKNGASGYVLKSDSPVRLLDALKNVADGKSAYSKLVLDRISQNNRAESSGSDNTPATRLANLTPREMEVLRYIGRGHDNDEMAQAMSLSKRTVERHVARLMDSLDIRDRFGLMKFARDNGLAV